MTIEREGKLLMLGTDAAPKSIGQRIVPQTAAGLSFMSMGLIAKIDQPLIWRGPMATKAGGFSVSVVISLTGGTVCRIAS